MALVKLENIPAKDRSKPWVQDVMIKGNSSVERARTLAAKVRGSKMPNAAMSAGLGVVGGVAHGFIEQTFPTVMGFPTNVAVGVALAGFGMSSENPEIVSLAGGVLAAEASIRTQQLVRDFYAQRAAA